MPPLALTLGEPAGIGPDITFAAWRNRAELGLPPFYLLGDPRYLAVITTARAEQAKLLGAHAPATLRHTGADGGPIPVQLIEVIAPAEPEPDLAEQP